MQSVGKKKSLSSYTDCSIHLFFMYSQRVVRSSPQKKSPIALVGRRRMHRLRDSKNKLKPVLPFLAPVLVAMRQGVWGHTSVYRVKLEGRDPTDQPLLKSGRHHFCSPTLVLARVRFCTKVEDSGDQQAQPESLPLRPPERFEANWSGLSNSGPNIGNPI